MPQVFFAEHNRLQASVEDVLPLLSAERAERVNRAKTSAGKLQSASASLLLESQLQNICGLSASELSYGKSDRGKPYLKRQTLAGELSFSISHCDEWAACGISRKGEIGVDVELIGRGKMNVVESRFCQQEARLLKDLAEQDEQQWHRAFTILWTAKEAVAKCLDEPLMEILGETDFSSFLVEPLFAGTIQYKGVKLGLAILDLKSHILSAASTNNEEITFHHIDK